MATPKELKEAERIAREQRVAVEELQQLGKDIERCERSIVTLKEDLEKVNITHAARQSTQDDINYLEDLLACLGMVRQRSMRNAKSRIAFMNQRVDDTTPI